MDMYKKKVGFVFLLLEYFLYVFDLFLRVRASARAACIVLRIASHGFLSEWTLLSLFFRRGILSSPQRKRADNY